MADSGTQATATQVYDSQSATMLGASGGEASGAGEPGMATQTLSYDPSGMLHHEATLHPEDETGITVSVPAGTMTLGRGKLLNLLDERCVLHDAVATSRGCALPFTRH